MTAVPAAVIQGNIKRMNKVIDIVRKDITRAEKAAADLPDFIDKISIYTNVNPVATEAGMTETLEFIKGIAREYDRNVATPIGGQAEVVRETVREHTMDYVTKMGDDLKDNLRSTLDEAVKDNLSIRDTSIRLQEEVNTMSKTRANMIARTETVRARNLASYYTAQEKGMNFFAVVSAGDCCDECAAEYSGQVFEAPDDLEMLPPLHPNCRCDSTFFFTEDHAQSAVDRYNPKEEEGEGKQ